MTLIKIYTKDFAELTTFFESEVDNLEYENVLDKIGECSFFLELENEKVSSTNLQHFNRVEIIENDVVQFVGFIQRKEINFDIVRIRCKSLVGILDKRILGASYAANGTLDTVVTSLISSINTEENTGISVGEITGTGNVNKIFNRAKALTALRDIVDTTGNQLEIDGTRKLNVRQQIGSDKTASVLFQYDVDQISSANILSFQVEDDGDDIVSRVYGKSGVRTSTQENETYKNAFGLVEKYRDFRVANSQTDLDDFTSTELRNNRFSPNIQLSPNVEDNFNVGDTVRVKIKNKLVNIDSNFQILQKKVQYMGNQKRITVRVSDLPKEFLDKLRDVEERLDLLEENV